MKDVTDDQLKEMWRQTQILAQKKTGDIRNLKEELSGLSDHSMQLEIELVKRGYRITKRIWSY
ncbi:hypothetical protein RCIP0012_00123 [Klebsiella phage RCIP0012]|uniref:Uncharacterized protein n=1 Tax=Klebsiella phage May TaxID=2054272 RepID=A0A2H5BP45_9CAUD|nr:hypothetical protein HOS53_gp066 [Klebsiella phage May]AUG88094.1 hypothetical protein CPT_May_180 [Klebsiella phage May]